MIILHNIGCQSIIVLSLLQVNISLGFLDTKLVKICVHGLSILLEMLAKSQCSLDNPIGGHKYYTKQYAFVIDIWFLLSPNYMRYNNNLNDLA